VKGLNFRQHMFKLLYPLANFGESKITTIMVQCRNHKK